MLPCGMMRFGRDGDGMSWTSGFCFLQVLDRAAKHKKRQLAVNASQVGIVQAFAGH